MKISANEIKLGNVLDYKQDLWQVVKKPEHTKPGKGVAYIQLEIKNLRTKIKLNKRFSSTDNVEKAFVERRKMQYLYSENNYSVFMDKESFEQTYIENELIGAKLPLINNTTELIEVDFYNDTPINIRLPTSITVRIVETSPIIKGPTIVSSSYKPAILANGLKINVPTYLINGDLILVKSLDLTFIERVK